LYNMYNFLINLCLYVFTPWTWNLGMNFNFNSPHVKAKAFYEWIRSQKLSLRNTQSVAWPVTNFPISSTGSTCPIGILLIEIGPPPTPIPLLRRMRYHDDRIFRIFCKTPRYSTVYVSISAASKQRETCPT
jgi:hypothetical protein